MRGRKPKPTQLKLLQGTFRKDRAGNEPDPECEAPPAPSFLEGTALREWLRIVPELEKVGLVSRIDQSALAAYCQARADYSWAVYKIKRDGGRLLRNPKDGSYYLHPAMRVKKDAAEQIRKFSVEFGLTPSSRGRINLTPPDTIDPEDEEFFGD